uniref:Oxysterol-binding protein n=1 Tax=Callorhinchus milii TaxID=7868 RepID=A0A4W3J989_CALMI
IERYNDLYHYYTGYESDDSESTASKMLAGDSVKFPNKGASKLCEQKMHNPPGSQENGIKQPRTALPAPMFSRSQFSLWSILKKCIGLELSKITMPIIFNEPLSFLQRITEYMEHTYVLHKASLLSDSVERLQAVAAFAVSAVASQWERTGKPFNPLLGETYELRREDLGFRFVSEQVSHHPPVSAFYSEALNKDFVFHGSIYPKLKFWGKIHFEFVGKLHFTGEKCVLQFKSCGLFGKELHRVEGYIQDKSKKKVCVIYGKWTECLWCIDINTYETHRKNDKRGGEQKKAKETEDVVRTENDEADDMPEIQETVQVIPGSKLLWRITARPAHSSQMYNFTHFAMMLNELDEEMKSSFAPTDCRFRPDIRAMESGNMELAGVEKERLEEKQRAARKERAKGEDEWTTRWFRQDLNRYTGTQDWIYTGKYWERNYEDSPDIY